MLEYLSDQVVDEALSYLLATRLQARNFKIDSNAIMESLAEAKNKICMAAQQAQERAGWDESKDFIERSLLFLIGAGIAVVDPVYLDATPFGIGSGIGGLYLMALATDLL